MLRKARKSDRLALIDNFRTIYELPEFTYLYQNGRHKVFELPPESEHDNIYVSLKDGIVIGYFYAFVDKTHGYADDIVTINFTGEHNYTFAKDLRKFYKTLFNMECIYKATFYCIDANTRASNLNAKLIKLLNGEKIGTFKDHVMLRDGKRYDVSLYEVFKSNIKKL